MGKKKRRPPSAEVSPSMLKARLVELIVADMHAEKGVKVERNVRLPVRHSKRTREIDVLITSTVAGYPVRIVIECKNYGRVIDAPDIDNFIGKLGDVGVPTQHGIYVTTRRFSKGAVERAEKDGIRPLILTGLTNDRVAAAVREATQTVVFLLPMLTQTSVSNDLPQVQSPEELHLFFNEQGLPAAYIADLAWDLWRKGSLSTSVGPQHVPLTIPPGWFQIIDEKQVRPSSVSVELVVWAAVLCRQGETTQHALINAASHIPEKFRITARFPTPSAERQPLTLFDSEAALTKFLNTRPGVVRSVGRITLPRLRAGPIYWPPSERVARALHLITQDYLAGRIPEPTPQSLEALEGETINAAWEPIWPQHIFPPKQDAASDSAHNSE